MSLKIGDFDVANQLLENEFRIGTLEKLLERVINSNPNLNRPTQADIENIRIQTAEELRRKYPNSGIEYTTNNQ